jgi:hypothetical protein
VKGITKKKKKKTKIFKEIGASGFLGGDLIIFIPKASEILNFE